MSWMWWFIYPAGMLLTLVVCWFIHQSEMNDEGYCRYPLSLGYAIGFMFVWPIMGVIAIICSIGSLLDTVWNKKYLFKSKSNCPRRNK